MGVSTAEHKQKARLPRFVQLAANTLADPIAQQSKGSNAKGVKAEEAKDTVEPADEKDVPKADPIQDMLISESHAGGSIEDASKAISDEPVAVVKRRTPAWPMEQAEIEDAKRNPLDQNRPSEPESEFASDTDSDRTKYSNGKSLPWTYSFFFGAENSTCKSECRVSSANRLSNLRNSLSNLSVTSPPDSWCEPPISDASMQMRMPESGEAEEVLSRNHAVLPIAMPASMPMDMSYDSSNFFGSPGMAPLVPVQMIAPLVYYYQPCEAHYYQSSEAPWLLGFDRDPVPVRGLQLHQKGTAAVNPVLKVLLSVPPFVQLLVSLPPQCHKLRPTLRALSLIGYLHEPTSAVNCWYHPDAANAFQSTLEAYHCQCDDADADDPAHFMSFILQRLHIETSWGPEEYPFRDQNACPAEIQGSALRNIFGGTLLLSSGLKSCKKKKKKSQVNRRWLLQPFEMLRVDLPSESTAMLQTLIGSANRCIGNDNMEFQIDGLCGAPPVLIIQIERCLENNTCHVSYGMELQIPTENPQGSVADVTYDLLGAIFQDPETTRGCTYAAVRTGQQWTWVWEETVEPALWEDVASRQTEIRLAIYVRRDCPLIWMHPPNGDTTEFWMAQAPDG